MPACPNIGLYWHLKGKGGVAKTVDRRKPHLFDMQTVRPIICCRISHIVWQTGNAVGDWTYWKVKYTRGVLFPPNFWSSETSQKAFVTHRKPTLVSSLSTNLAPKTMVMYFNVYFSDFFIYVFHHCSSTSLLCSAGCLVNCQVEDAHPAVSAAALHCLAKLAPKLAPPADRPSSSFWICLKDIESTLLNFFFRMNFCWSLFFFF